MRENQVPARLWDYGLVYIAEIQSLLARGNDQRPGIEQVMGQTVDISEWLDSISTIVCGIGINRKLI